MSYNVVAGRDYLFRYGGDLIELNVSSVETCTQDGVLFFGVQTYKFFMWFASSDENATMLTDTMYGVDNGVNCIYL